MRYNNLHRWDLTPKEAIKLQYDLTKRIILKKVFPKELKIIAGVDVSVKNNTSKAAIVILSYPEFEILETVTHTEKTSFPYIPGLLSFREGPVILECVRKLKIEPDVFVFDGQGLAHPRKIGLASHIGIFLERPCIGSAKTHLYGEYSSPGTKKGDFSLLIAKDGDPVGAALRTRDNIKPIFVSPGHLIDIDSSVNIILSCSPKYKLPEPIRVAHRAASL